MKRIKTKLFFSFFFVLFVLPSSAQSEAVKKIRAKYYETAAYIQSMKDGDKKNYHFSLTADHVLPGTGSQTQQIDFYFKSIEADDEGNYEYILLQVNRSYNVSMSYRVYEEFLFDDNNLVFYFERVTGVKCGEKRMYFKNEKLVDLKTKTLPDCDEETQMYTGKETGESFIENMAYVQRKANNLMKIFKQIEVFVK